MKCCDAEKYIMKYMDGEISQKEGEELNQHICMKLQKILK